MRLALEETGHTRGIALCREFSHAEGLWEKCEGRGYMWGARNFFERVGDETWLG